MAERRRLPVIQSPPPPPDAAAAAGDGAPDDPDATPPRPPWHWVGFGTVAVFAGWLPLAYGAQAIGERLITSHFGGAPREEIAMRILTMPPSEYWRVFAIIGMLHLLALALGALGGGYLVGRFGSGASLREPTAAGAITAFIALVVSLRWSGGITSAMLQAVPTLVVAVSCAALGGKLGLRRRARQPAAG